MGRAPAAGTREGQTDRQKRQEVAGCPELGEATWGMSVGRDQDIPGMVAISGAARRQQS